MFLGVPAVAANATGTLALWPGYVASAWRFRQDIVWPAGVTRWQLMLCVLVGGACGAGLLLATDQAAFTILIPWLILFATSLFALGQRLRPTSTPRHAALVSLLILFIVSAYGGYFNGGLGVVLLAALGLMGQTHLPAMNGMKNLISALLTFIAVMIYSLDGAIVWSSLGWMMVRTITGGYVGATYSYHLPAKGLRYFIVFSGLVISAVFFWRLLVQAAVEENGCFRSDI